MSHFFRVEQLALELARSEGRAHLDLEVMSLAALAHDVADHKYVRSPEERERLLEEMEVKLMSLGLTSVRAAGVCIVADNVSYTKELRGEIDEEGLEAFDVREIRDFVSDADKIDALGERGLQRVMQINRFDLSEGETHRDYLERLANRYIVDRVKYIVSRTARDIAGKKMEEMREVLETPERLRQMMLLTSSEWR